MENKEQKLTDKQRLFISEYLVDLNATRAAIAAGYSENTARQTGHENLTKPYIRDAVNAELKKRTLSHEEVLARLSDIATFDPGEYLERGFLDVSQMIKDGKSKFIKGITPTKEGTSYKFHDSHEALRDLGRYHVLFTDRIQTDTTDRKNPYAEALSRKKDE